MTLGKILKGYRERRGLSVDETAEKLGVSAEEYDQIEAGESPIEDWGLKLAHIGVIVHLDADLISEGGKSSNCKEGEVGRRIKERREEWWINCSFDPQKAREELELSKKNLLSEILDCSKGAIHMTMDELDSIEAGNSLMEKYGPLLLRFTEISNTTLIDLLAPDGHFFNEQEQPSFISISDIYGSRRGR